MFQSGDKLIVIDDSQNNTFDHMPLKIGDIVTCSYTTITSSGKLKVNVTEYPPYEFFGYRFKKHVPKFKKVWSRKKA